MDGRMHPVYLRQTSSFYKWFHSGAKCGASMEPVLKVFFKKVEVLCVFLCVFGNILLAAVLISIHLHRWLPSNNQATSSTSAWLCSPLNAMFFCGVTTLRTNSLERGSYQSFLVLLQLPLRLPCPARSVVRITARSPPLPSHSTTTVLQHWIGLAVVLYFEISLFLYYIFLLFNSSWCIKVQLTCPYSSNYHRLHTIVFYEFVLLWNPE